MTCDWCFKVNEYFDTNCLENDPIILAEDE